MTKIQTSLSTDDQKQTVEALQSTLIELIDLSIAGKQAHWNVVGSHFRSVHRQLDELVAATREHTDVVAERIVALGGTPDGRLETVMQERSANEMPTGYLPDGDAIKAIVDRLMTTIPRVRDDMRATEQPDPASQDLLNEALRDLEEQCWMFQAMLQ